jgi:hypothetical protein
MLTSLFGVHRYIPARRSRVAARAASRDTLDALRIAGYSASRDQSRTRRIYVRDGAIWTSAGVTTGIDLAMAVDEVHFAATDWRWQE